MYKPKYVWGWYKNQRVVYPTGVVADNHFGGTAKLFKTTVVHSRKLDLDHEKLNLRQFDKT